MQYLVNGSGNIGISLYNFTSSVSIGYADNLSNPNGERGNIIRIINLSEASQIGCFGNGTVNRINFQIDAIKIR